MTVVYKKVIVFKLGNNNLDLTKMVVTQHGCNGFHFIVGGVFFVTVLLFPGLAQSQTPPQVERLQQYSNQQVDTQIQTLTNSTDQLAPELYSGETSDVGPQFIVRSKPIRQWFSATVDSQYYYTSNVFLTEHHPADTTILVNTAEVAVAPTAFEVAGGLLAPRVGFRQQWYNYGLDNTGNQYNNFDFDVQTAFTDTRYTFYQTWYAQIGFEWTRLLQHEPPMADYSEFYKEYVPEWALGKYFPINDSMMFTVEYSGAYHVTNVDPTPIADINDRLDQGLRVAYTQELIPNLYLQPYLHFLYSDYVNESAGRNDYLFTGGVSLAYSVNKWATVRTFTSYDIKDSDNPNYPDYKNFNSGGGLTLSINF